MRVGSPVAPPQRIIGIVQNAAINSVDEPVEPYFYLPYSRASYGEAAFLVEARRDGASLAARRSNGGAHPALLARR